MFSAHSWLRSASEGVCLPFLTAAVAVAAADMVREGGATKVFVRIIQVVLGRVVGTVFLII